MSLNRTQKYLDNLWYLGKNFLETEYPIMAGAMSWISEHNLISAISKAGAFGILACGSMSPELLSLEILRTKKKTQKTFGVNLITMHPQINDLIEVCRDYDVSHIVLAGGLPSTHIIKKVKEFAKVICFAPALVIAKKLIKSGVDSLIIEGNEAGGHIGPVSLMVLVQEILPQFHNIPIFCAGGIARGEPLITLLESGAAGIQIGTRLVCAKECIAHTNFKKAFIRANARDAIPTIQVDSQFPVIPVRALANKGTEKFLKTQSNMIEKFRSGEISYINAHLEIEKFWAGSLRNAVIDGDVENGSVMAGQSVGLVKKEQSVADIINELIDQAKTFISNRF